MLSKREREKLIKEILRFDSKAKGVMRSRVVRTNDLGFARDLLLGDTYSLQLAESIALALRQIPQRDKTNCLACKHAFREGEEAPQGFMCLTAGMTDEPTAVIASPICVACCNKTDGELQKVGLSYARLVWPGLRTVMHDAGHG
jgi:hypothetical protein